MGIWGGGKGENNETIVIEYSIKYILKILKIALQIELTVNHYVLNTFYN